MRTYAAIRDDSNRHWRLVPARRHVYHRDPAAAERALERAARRLGATRGALWPAGAPVTTAALEAPHRHDVWRHVTTMAL